MFSSLPVKREGSQGSSSSLCGGGMGSNFLELAGSDSESEDREFEESSVVLKRELEESEGWSATVAQGPTPNAAITSNCNTNSSRSGMTGGTNAAVEHEQQYHHNRHDQHQLRQQLQGQDLTTRHAEGHGLQGSPEAISKPGGPSPSNRRDTPSAPTGATRCTPLPAHHQQQQQQQRKRQAPWDEEGESRQARTAVRGGVAPDAAQIHNTDTATRGVDCQLQQQQQQKGEEETLVLETQPSTCIPGAPATTVAARPPAGTPARMGASSRAKTQPALIPTISRPTTHAPGPVIASLRLGAAGCRAMIQRGSKKGSICGKHGGGRVEGFCKHHDGQQQRCRKQSTTMGTTAQGGSASGGGGAPRDPSAEHDGASYDYDGELGGGVEESQNLRDATIARDKDAHYRRASNIQDGGYRTAFEQVWHLKDHNPEREDRNAQSVPTSTHPDPRGWCLDPLPDDTNSDEFRERNKHMGGSKFSLSNGLRERLPKVDRAGLSAVRDFVDGKGAGLTFAFFEEAFPRNCQDIIINETNNYADFCAERTDPSPLQQQQHRDRKWERGLERVPSKTSHEGKDVAAFTRAHLFGVCGTLIAAGLVQKRESGDCWALDPEHDYTRVRPMPGDLFFLFYCRFLHMAPVIGSVEKNDPSYDSKHRIRALEVALNERWSALAEPGVSLSYDEETIKGTARASFPLVRVNKTKPITQVIKAWSVCCPSGYCFVQYVDTDFLGDPDLREHKDCPLGITTRTVLHVLLKACPTLAGKIDGSGVTIAMDDYFTSAALFLCLASRDIFAVGSLRSNRFGLDGAMRLWKEAGKTVTQCGDIMMARSGSGLAIITWVGSQVGHLLTTKHLFKSDWTPVEYERQEAGRNGGTRTSVQPVAHRDYVNTMRGGGVADKGLSVHAHDRKPPSFFWRRIFDQKFYQAVSNACLLFSAWGEELQEECKNILAKGDFAVASDGEAVKEEGCELNEAELNEFVLKLERLKKTDRKVWHSRLANLLLAKFEVGNQSKGTRRNRKVVPQYRSSGARSARVCRGGLCERAQESTSRYRTKRTRGVCWCQICSNGKGKQGAVHLCNACQQCEQGHAAASEWAKSGSYSPVEWV